jgi:hypothetical protein
LSKAGEPTRAAGRWTRKWECCGASASPKHARGVIHAEFDEKRRDAEAHQHSRAADFVLHGAQQRIVLERIGGGVRGRPFSLGGVRLRGLQPRRRKQQ